MIQAQLVGVKFRGKDAMALVRSLEIGDTLELEAEPSNPYDANAVKALFKVPFEEPQLVGYLAKESNHETSQHLQDGGIATAEVVAFLNDLSPTLDITLVPRDFSDAKLNDEFGPVESSEDD